jgi:hypothetical protein
MKPDRIEAFYQFCEQDITTYFAVNFLHQPPLELVVVPHCGMLDAGPIGPFLF